MSGLVSFLGFAVLFFLMMRFACGAHVGHGGHHHGAVGQHSDALASATDPVCDMHVAAGSGYATSYHGGNVRFCSRACLDKFDAAPDKYAGHRPQQTEHGGHSP